tara:strand:+ start:469 stop:750 length:282 start_codon:yes stop_codon:yes gene_type:complete
MCRCVSCNKELPRTRQFKKIVVPHKTNPNKVTKITLDGSNGNYPIVEEDMCSRCQSSTGSDYSEYEGIHESEYDLMEEIATLIEVSIDRSADY